MFVENNILPLTLLCIYILLIINITIFIVTMYIKIKSYIKQRKYDRVYTELYSVVNKYIDDENNLEERFLNFNKLERKVIFDILLTYSHEKKKNISEKFESLGYVDEIISRSKKTLTLSNIKNLGLIKSHKAYEVLTKGIEDDDFELKYNSMYAISLLELNKKEISVFLDKLLRTDILRDRMIEMVNNLSLTTQEYFDLLKNENSELGKVVLLRVLENRIHKKDFLFSDKLVPYLKDTKEVRLATVIVLSSTQNKKYFYDLINLYKKENSWEVRSTIAKSIIKFNHENYIFEIKEMVYDSNWWVRFNAIEVLARKGYEGINALIDISLEGKDRDVSSLAYSFLDSSQSVNKTLNMHKGGLA